MRAMVTISSSAGCDSIYVTVHSFARVSFMLSTFRENPPEFLMPKCITMSWFLDQSVFGAGGMGSCALFINFQCSSNLSLLLKTSVICLSMTVYWPSAMILKSTFLSCAYCPAGA